MKFALRTLLKSPGYTLVALVTLALGIGVNTAMFSLVDALLYRGGPFPHAEQLHQIIGDTRQGPRYVFSEPEIREMRARTSAFSSVTTFCYQQSALAEPGRPAEQVFNLMASAEFFDTFGVGPMLGRGFTADETRPGHNPVIVLSYTFWQQRFGGRRDVIGRALRVDGESVTIIGVMPASFDYRLQWGNAAFWRPLNFTPQQESTRTYRNFLLVGRLQPGATAAQATAELEAVARAQQKDFPNDYAGLRYRATLLRDAQMDDDSRHIVWTLLGLAGFVLLIACANLANLQLARATSAVREFAIRAALGASRGRLIRQQLTECLLLSAAGGGLGIVLALWVNHLLSATIYIGERPGGLDLELDPGVLVATIALAVLTGIIFGIVPAWFASRTDIVATLKSQSRGSTSGRGHHRMRQALVVAEVALALVLLGGAGVMYRGFDRYLHHNPGWDTDRVLAAVLPLGDKRFPTPESQIDFYRRIETRLGALPGVESVALATSLPIWDYGTERKIFTEQQASGDKANLPVASHTMVTSDFFQTLGVPLLEGHGFAPDLKRDSPKVIVINDALARHFWPGRSAIGQRLASLNGEEVVWSEVIGVVRTTEAAAAFGHPDSPYQIFRPIVHEPWSWVRLAVRSQAPAALIESVRRAVAEVDPDLPADSLMTIPQYMDLSRHNLVVVAQILGGFALLGLVLASVGIYGVISNLVAQRTGEFGIRLALGAQTSDVLGLVLQHGLLLCGIGLGLGLAGAYGLSRLLGSIIPRVVNPDPLALGGTAAALFGVALLACWLPARRATQVDPIVALRAE